MFNYEGYLEKKENEKQIKIKEKKEKKAKKEAKKLGLTEQLRV